MGSNPRTLVSPDDTENAAASSLSFNLAGRRPTSQDSSTTPNNGTSETRDLFLPTATQSSTPTTTTTFLSQHFQHPDTMDRALDDIVRERVRDELIRIFMRGAKLTPASSRTTLTDATARLPKMELKRFRPSRLNRCLSHCTLCGCDHANFDKRPSSEKRTQKRQSNSKRTAAFDKRTSLDKCTSIKKHTSDRRAPNRNGRYHETRYLLLRLDHSAMLMSA
jgi:hypothetical protein